MQVLIVHAQRYASWLAPARRSPVYGTYAVCRNRTFVRISENSEMLMLEGVSPRHGQPPEGGRKRVEKPPAKLVAFPLFRVHAVGRSPSAMGWLLHPWARHPSHVHEPACPTRARALPLLRLLDTPAQVIRLTADGHTPAEPLFCMSAATLHRWSSSARPLPEPETLTAGRGTVATPRSSM